MIAYRDARPDDAAALSAMAQQSFIETFGPLYAPADLDLFLDQAMSPAAYARQLADPAYRVHLATVEGQPIGFAKLGANYFDGFDPAAPCLHQLYVLSAHHGDGVGKRLMAWTLETAQVLGSELYLSVYIDNTRARRFYDRLGFVKVGDYIFRVGNHEDHDIIMRLTL
ncbi:GNAT family N-acetyltransferase [Sphingomonas spermidinifaciens]|uniref:GNAT family N-acetyltransferase n=1 Tax=Sphingomonas spermidinifaciens TaxID=1141889 RepID=A0A2A4B9J9_9SPHN|nr:GNAT family N-acetyltransferase [Sphingomonas spermidinifaciens]PCD04336.1 GNAT family N-acetyltransferase [Sphingomonas spermidinifaciens]